jgi:hypothetical protein
MPKHLQHKSTLFFLLLAVVVSACAVPITPTPSGSGGGWLDWDGKSSWDSSAEGAEPALGRASAELDIVAEEAPAMGAPLEFEAGEAIGSSESSVQNAALRAGSVDDNAEWDDYLLYRLRFADWNILVNDLDISERHILQVLNNEGQPVLGAELIISDLQGEEVTRLRTHADGRALFFPRTLNDPSSRGYLVRAVKEQAEIEVTLKNEPGTQSITLDTRSSSDPTRLDILFLIDATGSMADEISQLKQNMIAVSEKIQDLGSQPDVRFGMTIYRDREDLFVTRTFDFTPDVEAFTEALEDVSADGGGDYPESLNEGLHDAIHLPEWRLEDTVSLIFLVADAPPQLRYEQDYDYAVEALEAAQRGIKILPIASSGLDDQGEYIFRQLAQATAGKFLFLTYGAGGVPGDDTTHHVDDYSVLSLDELVVRLVEEELEALQQIFEVQ